MSVNRQKGLFLALMTLGAGLGFVSAARPWAVASIPDLVAAQTLRVSGGEAAGAVPAVALVALAGAVAVLTTRRAGQAVTGALLALAGAAAASVSVGVLRAPESAVAAAVTAATGRAGAAGVTAQLTAWPWAGVSSGILVAVGGCIALLRARAWAGLSARYETPSTTASKGLDDDPGLTWDLLSRGEDPTR